jgi:nicotinamidase-related amidase
VRDVLLLIDVLSPFDHDDGERLAQDFRATAPALIAALSHARDSGIPVVYANDMQDRWDADRAGLIRRAFEGRAGDVVRKVAPVAGEALILKPRYSAFDRTPLQLLLGQLDAERLIMAGTATEMCVAQTAIDARELGHKVTVLTDACASVNHETAETALAYLEGVVGVRMAASQMFSITSLDNLSETGLRFGTAGSLEGTG